MQDDAPAAIPLTGLVAGLLVASGYRDAVALLAVAALLLALRRSRSAMAILACALGIAVSVHARHVAAANALAVRAMPAERFVTIRAEIDHDWLHRDTYHALRLRSFRIGERRFDEPLTVVARFPPTPLELESTVVAEGFLRANEREELTLVVKSPRLLGYEGHASRLSPATWNRALANRLRPFARRFPTEVAIAEALALGRGEWLAEDVRESYKRAGTYHLLVFSGLQIAFAAGALAAALRWLRRPRASDWSLLSLAIAAPLFIGPNASVSRASLAIGIYAVSRLLHRPTTLENLWCVAALVWLTAVPGDLTNAGFQLTYGGAAALLFVAKPLAWRRLRWLVYALSVECIVTSMTLFHFHQYALGGSMTTVLLTPLISAMLAVSAAVCALPCAPLLHLLGALHWLSMRVNDVGATAAGAFAAPPAIAFGAAWVGALVAISVFSRRIRAAAILLCALVPIAFAIAVSRRDVRHTTISVLDIGQGDGILIRTPGHAMLVDGGPNPARIIPLLADRGVRRLDVVVLTHAHPDHCGGLPAILTRLPVSELWISPRRFLGPCATELLESASAEEVPIHLVRNGDRFALGTVQVRVLTAGRTFRQSPENNSSVVLYLSIGSRAALLTGDIEREAERDIASLIRCADVLKVGHHGSRTSTTPPLLDAAEPRVAIISCGRHNMFGHPHPSVLEALRQRRIRVWRTDRDGSVEVTFGRDAIAVRGEIDTP